MKLQQMSDKAETTDKEHENHIKICSLSVVSTLSDICCSFISVALAKT